MGEAQKMRDEPGVALIKQIIKQKSGLDCDQYKDNYLGRRLAVRMRAAGVKDHMEYADLIRRNEEEFRQLIDELTINVTQFYRDPPVFNALAEEIIPLIILAKAKRNQHTIRIWSAGCSSGEEPYTLSMIANDLLDGYDEYSVSITATDIDDYSLGVAEEGRYAARQLATLPMAYREKYFEQDGNEFKVKGNVRSLVKFKRCDLFSEVAGKNYDLILCRNVVIYFTKECQEELYMRFYESLMDEGYLVLGNTENLNGPAAGLLTQVLSRERVYQKKRGERSGSAP
jgi:chemotaxis protein methyltransferase CheR